MLTTSKKKLNFNQACIFEGIFFYKGDNNLDGAVQAMALVA